MFSCPKDARHVRGFINDPQLMAELVAQLAVEQHEPRA